MCLNYKSVKSVIKSVSKVLIYCKKCNKSVRKVLKCKLKCKKSVKKCVFEYEIT